MKHPERPPAGLAWARFPGLDANRVTPADIPPPRGVADCQESISSHAKNGCCNATSIISVSLFSLESDGKLTLPQALRCRVRYFSDGVVLGSKTFVEDVIQRNREQFGLKRKSGARPLRRAEAGDLCTMRDLRLEVISPPKAA